MKYFKYFWILALISFIIFTSISIYLNPWFSIFSNAYSDLGNPLKTSYYYLFNVGLITTSIFLFLFTLDILLSVKEKQKIVGSTIIIISSIFLSLIGIFNESTKPHLFISYCFFIQYFIGYLIYRLDKFSILIFILAFIGLFIPFPSIALLETYEITLLSISILKLKNKKSNN